MSRKSKSIVINSSLGYLRVCPRIKAVEETEEDEECEKARQKANVARAFDEMRRGAVGEQKPQRHCEAEKPEKGDPTFHIWREDLLVAPLRSLAHNALFCRLAREGKTAEGVHYEVQPKHLHDRHGRIDTDKGPRHRDADGGKVDGELEADEFSDAFEDIPTEKHGVGDAVEVV